MPTFSCFTGFGFLEFSSAPSECEKVYRALCEGYRDPKTGKDTIDVSVGTHQEAKIFGWANAIAAARVTLRRAGNEIRPETSYELLESHEEKFGMAPTATDTVAMRRTALGAKQKLARGPRYEAIREALAAIYGDLLIEYRPTPTTEATPFPTEAFEWDSPGLFRRPDAVAKSIRILGAITRTTAPTNVCAEYSEMNVTGGTEIASDTDVTVTGAAGQSFTGDGRILSYASVPLKKLGAPTGTAYLKIYLASGGTGTYVPTGAALATSEAFDVTTLTTSYGLCGFYFTERNRITLVNGTNYVLVLEYAAGIGGVNEVLWGWDGTSPAGPGNWSGKTLGVWTASTARDFCFHLYTGLQMTVAYENWNRSLEEIRIVKGDVLVVDGGNWGLAERVEVLEAEGEGDARTITALFRNPHSANIHATTGSMPLWSNTKRHVLIVVTSAAAVDRTMLDKTNELFTRIMRAPTTWAIVQSDGVSIGPLVIGATLGSPLGCVTVEQVTL